MSVDGDILEEIARAIRAVGLDAVVVGNAASEIHGAPISTEDVDLLVRDTPRNRQKLQAFVRELGGVGLTNINDLIDAKRIYLPDYYVDIIFNKIGGGLSFSSVKSRAKVVLIRKHSLKVASLRDVIKSKEAANRDKDRAVLPILRATLATIEARDKG